MQRYGAPGRAVQSVAGIVAAVTASDGQPLSPLAQPLSRVCVLLLAAVASSQLAAPRVSLPPQAKFYVLKNVTVLVSYRHPDDAHFQSVHVVNDYACRPVSVVPPKAARILGTSDAAAPISGGVACLLGPSAPVFYWRSPIIVNPGW